MSGANSKTALSSPRKSYRRPIIGLMESADLAWMAGFLEGEGYFVTQTSKRGYVRMRIGATSTDLDVLEHLQRLVPRSCIQGPYGPTRTSYGTKPHWKWILHPRIPVVELAGELRPLMGSRRQEQIDALLRMHASHPAVRNRTPSPAEHGTATRYRRGCRCESCRAAENAYQRERRVLRKALLSDPPDS
jgi:hypothetical protein